MDEWKRTNTIPDNAFKETIDWLLKTLKDIKGFGDKILEILIHDEIDAWIQRLHFELLAITLNCRIIMDNLINYKSNEEYELLNIIRDINHSVVNLLYEIHKTRTLPNHATLSGKIDWLNVVLDTLKKLTSNQAQLTISEINISIQQISSFEHGITEFIRFNFLLDKWNIQ